MDPSLVERMKVIRRDIHAHPELGFEEYRTQALVRDTLLSAGVDAAAIKVCAKTGLVVDITGRCADLTPQYPTPPLRCLQTKDL